MSWNWSLEEMTEREYAVDASTVSSSTVVIVDDKDLVGLSPNETKQLIIDKAIEENNWQYNEDRVDEDTTYEVYEND